MEIMSREECIARIMEHEQYGGYGQEDMPELTSKKFLLTLSNEELVSFYEDLTTNYGIYQIED